MARTRRTPLKAPPARWYRGADVLMRVIRRFARQVAERFRPDKLILFGSYAYGTPHADSDVDILVIMPAHNELDQAAKIACEVQAPFAEDRIVLKPQNVKWRLEEGDSFLTEIMTKGKVLYEKDDSSGYARPKPITAPPCGRLAEASRFMIKSASPVNSRPRST
jgi:predicted nucleotidyltransferase